MSEINNNGNKELSLEEQNKIIESIKQSNKEAEKTFNKFLLIVVIAIIGFWGITKIVNSFKSPEAKIETKIEKVLGKNSNRKDNNGKTIKKVRKVSIVGSNLKIELSANDGWDDPQTLTRMHSDVVNVMKKIDIPSDIKSVEFYFYYSFFDSNYNVNENLAAKIKITNLTADWKYIPFSEVPNVSSEYWIHPAFIK